jgi:hypothetical protein
MRFERTGATLGQVLSDELFRLICFSYGWQLECYRTKSQREACCLEALIRIVVPRYS